MTQALFMVSGVAIGLLAALVAVASSKTEFMSRAEAQAGPGGAGAGGTTILGTGGATNNQNDLCWVLTRVKPVRGPERTVLARFFLGGPHRPPVRVPEDDTNQVTFEESQAWTIWEMMLLLV